MESNLNYLADQLVSGALSISALDDGSGVVLDVAGERLLTMNASAIAIMHAIQSGCRDRAEIASRLAKQFAIPADQAESDVSIFVDTLSQQVRAGQQ